LKNNSKKIQECLGSVETYPFWKGKWQDKEAALCELLKTNNIFLNPTEVEAQVLSTDSLDLKGQAEIGATELEQNYDDLESWITNLDTTDIVGENELVLFPQLDQPTAVSELSQCHLEEFVSINPVVQSESNLSNNATMEGNFDFAAFLQLDKGNLDEEVATAAKLLSEEENGLTDMLISYMERDSNVSSPEMSNQSVDILLDELIQEPNEADDVNVLSLAFGGGAVKSFSGVTADMNLSMDLLSEIKPSVEQGVTTVDSDFYFPDNVAVDEKVINEFANLLNSLDDSLNCNAVPSEVSNTISGSVDFLSTTDDVLVNIEASGVSYIYDYSVESVPESSNSPDGCTSTVQSIPAATKFVNKEKRKRCHTISEEEVSEMKVSRRMKNNEASKVTRAKRRNKHQELFETERKLTESNAELRMKLEVMQKEADILRQLLVVALNNSNKT